MKVSLLVLDDDKCCGGIFKAYLDFQEDWEVSVAESSKEAFELLEKKSYDVVVSDLKMPEMNGMVFLSKVSAKYPDSVRILFSASKLSVELPSYIHFQYEKGKFSMKELVDKVSAKLAS